MSFLLLSEPARAEVSDSHTWPEWQPKTPKIPKPQTAPNIFFVPTYWDDESLRSCEGVVYSIFDLAALKSNKKNGLGGLGGIFSIRI